MALGRADYECEACRGNLLFYGREILGQFAGWSRWSEMTKHLLMVPCFCLSAFMIVGMGYAWCQRRDSEGKLRFLVFTAVVTGALDFFTEWLVRLPRLAG